MGGLGHFWTDLRYGARLLVRHPGFTAAAVSSLALGIGANPALFSVTDALMLRMLPVPHAEDIVRLRTPLSYPAFRTMRDQTQTLSGMCAFSVFPASVRLGEEAEQAVGQMVSGDSVVARRRWDSRRRRTRRPGRRDQLPVLAAPLRPRPDRRRPDDHAQRRPGHDRRCGAAEVLRRHPDAGA